jgi:Cys-tRNA(Pro)/Cys-tRNA(Cys) deacylase
MVHTVRSLIARVTWLFDDAVALIVILLTYTVTSAGRLPGGVQEFLAVRLTVRNVALAIVFIVIWHSCFAMCGLYRLKLRNQPWLGGVRIVAACTMASAALSVFTLASRSGAFALAVVAYFWVAVVLTELIGRSALAAAGRYLEHHTRDLRHAVIVGSGPMALKVYAAIQARESKDCVVIGFVDSRSLDEMPHEIRSRLIGTLEELESATATAEDAARAAGSPLAQIVKSIVVVCDDRAVMALVPGDRRADLDKIARAANAGKARIATAAEVQDSTGFAPGAVAPFPLPKVELVLIDQGLLAHDTVWIGAGSPAHLAALSPADLVRLARARPIDAVQEA